MKALDNVASSQTSSEADPQRIAQCRETASQADSLLYGLSKSAVIPA